MNEDPLNLQLQHNPQVLLTGSSALIVQNAQLKALCLRAADALESFSRDWEGKSRIQAPKGLIAELRHAAE